MKTWSLKLTAVTSSIVLGLMVARCVPVKSKSSEASTPTANREATTADISVHIVKVDPKDKDQYFLEFSSNKEVEKFKDTKVKIAKMDLIEKSDRGSNRYPLTLSKKTASDKTRQIFEGSVSVELNPEMTYTLVAYDKDDNKIYKEPRTFYFKKKQKSGDNATAEIKWESVQKVLIEGCAGGQCHYMSGGEVSFNNIKVEGWYLVDEKSFKEHKDLIKTKLEDNSMPKEGGDGPEFRAQEKKLLIDYISQLN